jgi:hypothetical protein
LIFSRPEVLLSAYDEFIEIFGGFHNCRVSLLICAIGFYFPYFSVILVKVEPFIDGWLSFVIFLSFFDELLLKFFVSILQVEAHVIVEDNHLLLSFFEILEASELKFSHVPHDIGVALFFFQCMI